MNREQIKELSGADNRKMGRRSLLGMTVAGLAGSLAACSAGAPAADESGVAVDTA
jgi:hypothetical protein